MNRKQATCHPEKQAKGRGLCGACYDKILKTENPEYKKRQAENTKNWVKRNPKKANKIYTKYKKSKKGKLKRQENQYKKYGITIEDYNKMLIEQNYCCKICHSKPALGKKLHVDHCHTTKSVRGLLCFACNWYLGKIDKNSKMIWRLWVYQMTEGNVNEDYYNIFNGDKNV